MAQVYPFHGLRYAAGSDYRAVVTPPYDIIDPVAQNFYHQRHPHNVIRLELGYQQPTDTAADNRYTRAAATLGDWLDTGVLQPEAAPALYLYEEDFEHAGQRSLRTSVFAAVQVTDYGPGRIMPHEHTLAKPVEDRLSLLRACHTNFSPIFGLYPDDDGAVVDTLKQAAHRPPDVGFTDDAGTHHRLWAVTDAAALQTVAGFLAPRSIYIADGHHRYETALRYHREHPDRPGSDRVLMVLTALTDPGLVVLPTHRVAANLGDLNIDALVAGLSADFRVQAWPTDGSAGPGTGSARSGAGSAGGTDWIDAFLADLSRAGEGGLAMGMYGGGQAYLLELRGPEAMAAAAPDRPEAWRRLDVAVLQTLVMEKQLGVGAEQARAQQNLTYTRAAAEAVQQVQAGSAQLAFFMNPLPVAAVKAVSDARENMPQKSTYFYPKFLTGVVLHKLAAGR